MHLFYRERLSGAEQRAYDMLADGFKNMNASIPVTFLADPGALSRIWSYVLYDDPTLFYVAPEMKMESSNFYTVLKVSYTMSASEVNLRYEAIDDEVNRFLSTLPDNASQYELALLAYEHIVKSCEYDKNVKDQSMYSAFVKKRTTCAGYTRAFQYLMGCLSIPCAFANGSAYGKITNGPHAWNLVKLDGCWCWCDLTWADPVYLTGKKDPAAVSYDYFALCDDDLRPTHRISAEIAPLIPKCSSPHMNWYARHNLIFDSYDEARIAQALQADALSREIGFDKDLLGESFIRFTNEGAYRQAQAELVARGGMKRAIAPVFDAYSQEIIDPQYMKEDALFTIHMKYRIIRHR